MFGTSIGLAWTLALGGCAKLTYRRVELTTPDNWGEFPREDYLLPRPPRAVGALHVAVVDAELHAMREALHACPHDRGGQLTEKHLRFTVDAEGVVSGAAAGGDSPEWARCAEAAAEAHRFPASRGSTRVRTKIYPPVDYRGHHVRLYPGRWPGWGETWTGGVQLEAEGLAPEFEPRFRDALLRCADRQPATRVELEMVPDARGVLRRIRVVESDALSLRLEDCLIEAADAAWLGRGADGELLDTPRRLVVRTLPFPVDVRRRVGHEPQVGGGLSQAEVLEGIATGEAALQACAETSDPPWQRRLDLILSVDTDGRVHHATTIELPHRDEGQEACTLEAVRGMRFPASKRPSGVALAVSYKRSWSEELFGPQVQQPLEGVYSFPVEARRAVQTEVQAALDANLPALQACASAMAERDPTYRGAGELKLRVGPQGVEAVEIRSQNSRRLDFECGETSIRRGALGRLRFDPPVELTQRFWIGPAREHPEEADYLVKPIVFEVPWGPTPTGASPSWSVERGPLPPGYRPQDLAEDAALVQCHTERLSRAARDTPVLTFGISAYASGRVSASYQGRVGGFGPMDDHMTALCVEAALEARPIQVEQDQRWFVVRISYPSPDAR
ncbi:MAG: hypothetical protein H6741_25445 [Alphaproteobacteria bacterium]|nr:hypothetical protein [Alphaproteobacteria bacterium]